MLRSRLAFYLLLAAAMVGTRLVCFDYEMFFRPTYLPNHDMSAALPSFLVNAHCMAETGDLAWWNPVSFGGHGHALYYQSFLSPMAPTSGNIVFVAWMQAVRLLALCGVRLPEYYQFLTFTYIVLPFLALLSFAWFAGQLFRRRATVALVTVAYSLSGLGLWNSAWFYFQEPFTLFFLLGAFVAATRRPTAARGLILLAAVLIQFTSLNYWTFYNSWFVAILLGAYSWTYPERLRRAWQVLPRAAAVGVLAVVAVWAALLVCVVREQSDKCVRDFGAGVVRSFSREHAISRVHGARWFTFELFNPVLPRDQPYTEWNEMHSARYVGLALLPPLLIFPLGRWRRSGGWLAATAAAVFCVCLAPPFLLALWEATPGVNRVRHFFLFYSHHWQLMVALLAGLVFDRLARPTGAAVRDVMARASVGLGGAAALALLAAGFVKGDPSFESLTLAAGLTLVLAAAYRQMALATTVRARALFAWGVVGLCYCDLTRYFVEVSQADHRFTRESHPSRVPYPLPADAVARMRQPWRMPAPVTRFSAVAENLPLRTVLWPDNFFLLPNAVAEVWFARLGELLTEADAPVRFYDGAELLDDEGAICRAIDSTATFHDALMLHKREGFAVRPSTTAGIDAAATFEQWGYNDFQLSVTAPGEGWLLLRQLHDRGWRVSIDGKSVAAVRANLTRMAVPITAGPHAVEMSYRPASRAMYWPAVWLVEATLAALLVAARLTKTRNVSEGNQKTSLTLRALGAA